MKYAIPRYYVNADHILWLSPLFEGAVYFSMWLNVVGLG